MMDEEKVKSELEAYWDSLDADPQFVERLVREVQTGVELRETQTWLMSFRRGISNLTKRLEIVAAIVVFVGLAGVAGYRNLRSQQPLPIAGGTGGNDTTVTDPSKNNTGDPGGTPSDEAAVVSVVENFGRKLQTVSLQAPREIVTKAMQENYGDLVSPELLTQWSSDPQKAPGRMTSSPWPDRITISRTEKSSEKAYKVQGEIVEVTSVEQTKGGIAAQRPISLVVERLGNRWLITAVTLGAYEQASSILYKNTEFGFNFSLPASWQGYTVVSGQWNGADPQNGKNSETGPMISIRHPNWTSEIPRQDIPIMIFTIDQWNLMKAGGFHIGAAPIDPSELGRNSKYVFALPARYNYAFPPGYEEVETILSGHPLRTDEIRPGA